MLKGKVVGNIVSTNKFDALVGFKFLDIRLYEGETLTDRHIIAVDQTISAGIGEDVLIVTGSSARVAVGDPNKPVDAVVAGVIDKIV